MAITYFSRCRKKECNEKNAERQYNKWLHCTICGKDLYDNDDNFLPEHDGVLPIEKT